MGREEVLKVPAAPSDVVQVPMAGPGHELDEALHQSVEDVLLKDGSS